MKGIFGSSISKVSAKNSSSNIHNTATPAFNQTRSQGNRQKNDTRGQGGGGENSKMGNSDSNNISGQDLGSNSVFQGPFDSMQQNEILPQQEDLMLIDSKGFMGTATAEELHNFLIAGGGTNFQKKKPKAPVREGETTTNQGVIEVHQSRAMNQTGVVLFRKDNNKRMQTEQQPMVNKLDHIPPLILKPTQVFSNTALSSKKNDGILPTPSSSSAQMIMEHNQKQLLMSKQQMNMTYQHGGVGGQQKSEQNSFLGIKSQSKNTAVFNLHIKSAEDVQLQDRKMFANKFNEMASFNQMSNTNESSSMQHDAFRQQHNMSTPLNGGGGNYSQTRQIAGQSHILFDPLGSASSSHQMTSTSNKHPKLHPQILMQQQQIVQSIVASSPGAMTGSLTNGLSGTQILKNQKPPISSSSHNSQLGTPQDQKRPPLSNAPDNSQQNGGSKNGGKNNSGNNNNKRIAISITQVGLTSYQGNSGIQGNNFGGMSQSTGGMNGSQSSNSKPILGGSSGNAYQNQDSGQVQYQQQNTQGVPKNLNDHRQQRFSNTMVSRGQSLPPEKNGGLVMSGSQVREEAIFQLPEVNQKQQQLQQVQSVQSTPIPRPKKQTIIIPNNTFHYVVGQSHINGSLPNQQIQQQLSGKYHSSQKGGPLGNGQQNVFNQTYAARFGFVINPIEAAQKKKAQFKNDNNPLMVNMVYQQNISNEGDGDTNYFYGGQSVNGGNSEDMSNPLGFSPMIKRIGDNNNMSYVTGSGGPSPLKLNDDQKLVDQPSFQKTPQASNSRTYLKNRQLIQPDSRLGATQGGGGGFFNNTDSPKKDGHQFTNVKPRPQKENKKVYPQYQDMMGNLIDPKQSYVIHENGNSERSAGEEIDHLQGSPPVNTFNLQSGKKLRQNDLFIESMIHEASGGFEYTSPGIGGTFDNNKMPSATKYNQFDSNNQGNGDPDRNFSAHVQSLYATTNSQSESGFVKTQPGFAVRKGQLVKTQNVQNTMGQTQTGGQWPSAQKQIRLSSEDQPNGKSNKKKESGSPVKNKNKFTEKANKQQPDQTDLQLEQAFQSILNQRAERLGAVKNYMQVYQKKQPATFLNISKIGAPNSNSNGNQNRNVQSRGNTENTNRQKQSMLQKIAQGFRQNIVIEKLMDPETPAKFGLTKRLMFKRRLRMKEKNVVIIYFDGVIGDIPYNQGQALGFNNFRVRSGSIKDLQQLCYQSQVVLVMPYTNKRSLVIAKYLQKFASCQFDALYSCRVKETRSTKKGYLRKWQDYEQIYRDFNLNEPHQIFEQCLVVACYTTELELINERAYNSDIDISTLIDLKYPELQGVSCIRARNEMEDIRIANPPTLLVPHMDLDIGSVCSFQTIIQTMEQMRQIHWQVLIHQHGGQVHHHKSPQGKLHHNQASHQNSVPPHHPSPPNATSGNHLQELMAKSHSHAAINHQSPQPNQEGSPTNNHGSPYTKYLHMPADCQPKINYMSIFNHVSTHAKGSQIDIGANRAWKLKGMEIFELQKTILQHENLADHLLLKTHWKRQAILHKYRKEDGTPGEEPTYDEAHPECTLYQFGTLMSDNSSIRTKAIEDYRRTYLEGGERAAKIVGPDALVPEKEQAEYIRNPNRAIPISEVSYKTAFSAEDNKNLNHRFLFLLPSAQVVQRLNQTGPYMQAFEYIDIIKELADNVPTDMQNLIATNQNSFEIQDWICRKMFTRPQNNGFIGPSGIAKRRGVSYIDADFHPNPPPNNPMNQQNAGGGGGNQNANNNAA